MLKLDFLQKHTIMLLKAELKGLNYTFPKRKNFYSILNNRIKNPFKRKRKKIPLRRRNSKKAAFQCCSSRSQGSRCCGCCTWHTLQSSAADARAPPRTAAAERQLGFLTRKRAEKEEIISFSWLFTVLIQDRRASQLFLSMEY